MKLVKYQNGRIRQVLFSVETHYSDTMLRASAIEREIQAFAQPNGIISCLSIDFAGQYVPIVHSCEARLVAALLASYQTESGQPDVHEAQETLEEVSVCDSGSVHPNHIRSFVPGHAGPQALPR